MSASDLLLAERERDQTNQMVVTMARLIDDGDFLAEGIGTFLPTAAYMLAKLTHAPSCTSLCPNGNTLMPGTRTLTLGHDEFVHDCLASGQQRPQALAVTYLRRVLVGQPGACVLGVMGRQPAAGRH